MSGAKVPCQGRNPKPHINMRRINAKYKQGRIVSGKTNEAIMKALLKLRKLRAQEKALKAMIEATEELAIIEAQEMTESGKFSYKGHHGTYTRDEAKLYKMTDKQWFK